MTEASEQTVREDKRDLEYLATVQRCFPLDGIMDPFLKGSDEASLLRDADFAALAVSCLMVNGHFGAATAVSRLISYALRTMAPDDAERYAVATEDLADLMSDFPAGSIPPREKWHCIRQLDVVARSMITTVRTLDGLSIGETVRAYEERNPDLDADIHARIAARGELDLFKVNPLKRTSADGR